MIRENLLVRGNRVGRSSSIRYPALIAVTLGVSLGAPLAAQAVAADYCPPVSEQAYQMFDIKSWCAAVNDDFRNGRPVDLIGSLKEHRKRPAPSAPPQSRSDQPRVRTTPSRPSGDERLDRDPAPVKTRRAPAVERRPGTDNRNRTELRRQHGDQIERPRPVNPEEKRDSSRKRKKKGSRYQERSTAAPPPVSSIPAPSPVRSRTEPAPGMGSPANLPDKHVSGDTWPVPVGGAVFALVVMLVSGLLMRWARVRTVPSLTMTTLPAGTRPRQQPSAPPQVQHNHALAPTACATKAMTAAEPSAEVEERNWSQQEAEVTPSEPPTASPVACKPAIAQVEVFGPLRVRVAEQEVSFGRADGRALLALLATSKDGESSESLIARLWPRDGERGVRRLETAIRDINGAMRRATGLGAEVKFVVKAEQRRSLPPTHFDVDWWRFEQAYVKANTADCDSGRREALRQMLDLYQGPFLAGRDDLWCLPLRQAALNQAMTAVTQLAELERKQDPDGALGTLTLAVNRIDPHSEVLWCQIMTIQGELGRLPAVELTFRQLTERLAEIDAKPGPQARRTYERFIK